MKKTVVLILLFLLTSCATSNTSQNATAGEVVATRHYHIQERIVLINEGERMPEKQNLWVALIRSVPPYQELRTRKISPDTYTLLADEYGNEYAEFAFSSHAPGMEITVEIDYELAVNEIVYDLGACQGEQLVGYTQAELHIEASNPQIAALADNLAHGTDCESVRAFYDHLGDTLTYRYNRNDWGAQATLGAMGADCTEYADLMIALSRAQKIPARYYEGLLFLQENTAQIAEMQHAWLDVHLPGAGWVAMDPTMGRLVSERDLYFAHYTADHIIVTDGRSPSPLRGASYLTHLYWPGNSTTIKISTLNWEITLLD